MLISISMKELFPYVIPFLGALTLFFSCRSGKSQPDTYEKRQLIFGTGGGYMGTMEEFVLLDNGQLYVQNSLTKEFSEIGKVSRKLCREFFKQADTLEVATTRFSNPGNKYFFLEVKDGNVQNRVTWGAQDAPIGEEFRQLYRSLMERTRQLKKQ